MTEDEAKTNACCGPWAVNWSGRLNHSNEAQRAQLCIGSKCMAWRWQPEADQIRALRERMETGLVEAWQNAEKLQEPAVAGFCGLAGRP